jgi:hypothetical protein
MNQDNKETLTAQEVFDQVVNHLRAQGRRAVANNDIDNNQYCKYRLNEDNVILKCAAGCLIRDEEYSDWMDNNITFDAVLANNKCPVSFINRLGDHENLIMALQQIHDRGLTESWEDRLKIYARQFKLIYSPPTV